MKRLLPLLAVLAALLAVCLILTRVAHAAPLPQYFSPGEDDPWIVATLDPDIPTSANSVTVAYGGRRHCPLISYFPDQQRTPAILFWPLPGENCLRVTQWNSRYIAEDVLAYKTSQMAYHAYPSSYKVGWAIAKADQTIQVESMVITDALTFSDPVRTTIVDLDFLLSNPSIDYLLHGPIALTYDGSGFPSLAFNISVNANDRRLYYAHHLPSNETPQNPCDDIYPGNDYECELVYQSEDALHSPQLVLTSSGSPRLSFYEYIGVGAGRWMYAYPSVIYRNCGTDGNPWRCITMEETNSDHNFSLSEDYLPYLDMAIGPEQPHLIARSWNANRSHWQTRTAIFVGQEGNCGYDRTGLSTSDYRWYCYSVDWVDSPTPLYTNFDLKVDSTDISIMAHNRVAGDVFHAFVGYRRFVPPENYAWLVKDIDGGPINTGYGIGLALGQSDQALIAYIEQGEHTSKLKYAYQIPESSYLPFLRR